jgi:hypothetical protein
MSRLQFTRSHAQRAQAREAAASPLVAPRGAAVELQDLRRAAFVDPNDPSVLFVPDPTAAPLDDSAAAPPAAYPHAA